MSTKELIVDLSKVDFDNVLADIEYIRRVNPQRHEMEQLTAVVFEDLENMCCVGYKDISDDEFWVRGHMPGMPLMPGVVMVEAAAQLCCFFAQHQNLLGVEMIGFGGLEEVRFRDAVLPGQRLILISKLEKLRPKRMIVSRFQGVVGDSMVVEGIIKGIAIPVNRLSKSEDQG